MTRRPGLTMTELLVAIFIVAIGLAGVMSMVPFGAKQMSDALVADRTTSHAATIDGLVRTQWQQCVSDTTGNGNNEPYWAALDSATSSPGSGMTLISNPNGTPPAITNQAGPSNPVFLDPMGVVGRTNTDPARDWVGDSVSPGPSFVPRRNMAICNNNPSLALRMWSQADGFTWDEDSQPATNGSVMTRELRYNALAVIQRPVNSNRNEATLKVVVFSGRRHLFLPPGSESVFSVGNFAPGSTSTQLPTTVSGQPVDVRKGMWLMDATVSGTIRHAYFYRVITATAGTDAGGNPIWDIELNTQIKRIDAAASSYTATIVLMPAVAAVFDRPMLVGTKDN